MHVTSNSKSDMQRQDGYQVNALFLLPKIGITSNGVISNNKIDVTSDSDLKEVV